MIERGAQGWRTDTLGGCEPGKIKADVVNMGAQLCRVNMRGIGLVNPIAYHCFCHRWIGDGPANEDFRGDSTMLFCTNSKAWWFVGS